MISKARLLHRNASFDELGGFALMSMMVVLFLGLGGLGLLNDVPELIGSSPALNEPYLSKLVEVLFSAVIVVGAIGFATLNYQRLQNTVARCELAEDELAWINKHSDYGKMVEDRELMRLAANVRRVCRTYPATDSLLVNFLEKYRALLNCYGSAVEKKRSALIAQMNEAAEESLEQHESASSANG